MRRAAIVCFNALHFTADLCTATSAAQAWSLKAGVQGATGPKNQFEDPGRALKLLKVACGALGTPVKFLLNASVAVFKVNSNNS